MYVFIQHFISTEEINHNHNIILQHLSAKEILCKCQDSSFSIWIPIAVATPGEVPKTRRQRELVTAGGTHIVFYEKDLEDFYLQSVPVVVAYNKVNYYTATRVISQEDFQS